MFRSCRKTTVVLGILGLGLLAALPFLRTSPPAREVARRPAADDLALRGVPLQVSSQSHPSPAIGLYDGDPQGARRPDGTVNTVGHYLGGLDQFGPPPDFNSAYPEVGVPDGPSAAGNSNEGRLRTRPSIRPASAEVKSAGDEIPRRHRIIDGDTLSRLARKYLGDSRRAREIFDANRDVLATPEVLPLGVELVIPLK